MNTDGIKKLLDDVASGSVSSSQAAEKLRTLPFMDVGCARYDSHRVLRNGFSEVIYCEGKKPEHVVKITKEINKQGHNVFGTRAGEEVASHLSVEFPNLDYDSVSRTFRIMARETKPAKGDLAIACGGTADLQVAEEARRTAEFFGIEARRFYDVGIAGLHRVLSHIDEIRSADAVIAVAGMEGALPSVLGGLIDCPIIAVPTSVGYGANLGGIAALLAMLNSCSEGIAVTNIDNGFGAACAALRIIRKTGQSCG
jgi:NCAIR mutase (PurE)-related protein